jgi:lysophospholipase L1-like esterase
MNVMILAFMHGITAWAQTPGQNTVEAKGVERAVVDWPNLRRYQNENARLPPPRPSENRVVFLGDSIIDSWGRRYGIFFSGKPYINRGISGQTTPQMLARFHADVVALKPKVVVILAGTNDIAGYSRPARIESIEANMTSMADLAKTNGIRVVFASVLPVCDYFMPQTGVRPPAKIIELNAWLSNYAATNDLVYLDYYSAMIDDKEMLRRGLTYDGLHPNTAGYELMRALTEDAIRAALK